jgi:protein tyrosine kinase modulator
LQESKKDLDQQEAALSAYKVSHVSELPQEQQELNNALARLQVQLEANRDAINRTEQSKLLLENTLHALEATIALMSQGKSPDATALNLAVGDPRPVAPAAKMRQSEVLQSQLDQLRLRYSDNYPEVKRLAAELARVKATEEGSSPPKPAEQTADSTPTTAKGVSRQAQPPSAPVAANSDAQQARARVENLKSQIGLADKEVENRNQDQQHILAEMTRYQNRIGRLPIREQEMAKLTRNYDISQLNYRSLLDKKFNADMGVDMERRQKSERFTLLDPATVPQKPFKPKRGALEVAASGIALALGLLAAFGRELNAGWLLGEWELPLGGAVILARVPHIKPTDVQEQRGGRSAMKRLLASKNIRLAMISSALVLLLGIIGAAVAVAFKGV